MLRKKNKIISHIKYLFICMFIIPPYITLKTDGFPGVNLERLLELYLILFWLFNYMFNLGFKRRINEFYKQYKIIIIIIIISYSIEFFSGLFFSENTLASCGNTLINFIGKGFLLFLLIGFLDRYDFGNVVKLILILELIIISLGFIEWAIQKPLFSELTFLNSNSTEKFATGNYRGRHDAGI